ncbi:hypothetical protein [Sediminibacillus albus]|nr:hypothetical protein [Sediminibacillus albus]
MIANTYNFGKEGSAPDDMQAIKEEVKSEMKEELIILNPAL